MANIFENMMNNSKNQTTSTPSNSSGRPMHGHWDGFEKIKINEKVSAKCLNCKKVFSNTAKARMVLHR